MAEEVKQEGYEYVNHPSHYNRYPVEAVEMARRIWGDDAMEKAAQITAFFYRMRMGLKPDVTVQQDLDKEEFWLNYSKKLHNSHVLQHDAESPGERTLLTD